MAKKRKRKAKAKAKASTTASGRRTKDSRLTSKTARTASKAKLFISAGGK